MCLFWTISRPMARCVPKSLVKILVSIGTVTRNRRTNAIRFCRPEDHSHLPIYDSVPIGELPPRGNAPANGRA
jgi:hypothetical protein